jgi:hypothetical protein
LKQGAKDGVRILEKETSRVNLAKLFGFEDFTTLDNPRKFFKAISDLQVKQLRLQGLSETAAVKIRIANEKLLGIKKDRVAILRDELALQQAIRKDQEKQLSTETQRLAEIGRLRGAEVAREVADVVQRRQTFEDFSNDASRAAKEALNEFFSGFVSQERNVRFLRGEGEFAGLGGETIPIRELIRKQDEQRAILQAQLDLQREQFLARFLTEPVTTTTESDALSSLSKEIPKLTEVLNITQEAVDRLNKTVLNPNIRVILQQDSTGQWVVTEINKDGSPVANAIDTRIEKK